MRVVDCALLDGCAPVCVSPFKSVLVAQHLARREVQAPEINLYLILIGSEVGQADVTFTERRERQL